MIEPGRPPGSVLNKNEINFERRNRARVFESVRRLRDVIRVGETTTIPAVFYAAYYDYLQNRP